MAGVGAVPSCCGQQRILSGGSPAPLNSSNCFFQISRLPSRRVGHPVCSIHAAADRYTDIAADSLRHGNGLARSILSDPAIESNPLAFLKATEAYWKAMKQQKHEPHKKGPTVITNSSDSFAAHIKKPLRPNSSSSTYDASAAVPNYDVIMCGGTLGIMVALALQQHGFRVAVVEKRLVQGRIQEWNTSRHECQVLVDLGLLTPAELEATIVTEFNPIRCGFHGGAPLWVNDCLNIGVNPQTLIANLRAKFESLGGHILEHTEFKSAVVCPDGVAVTVAAARDAPADVGDTNRPNALEHRQQRQRRTVQTASEDSSSGQKATVAKNRHPSNGGINPAHPAAVDTQRQGPTQLSGRLLLDCMGHYSPIVKQLRGRAKPEGMVLVVGGCATGFSAELNQHADLLYTMTDASADMQLFWEAFPAEGGSARTTYMFAYTDAHPSRPSFEQLLDTYFRLLPAYQHLPGIDTIQFKRVLFGGFPCYGSSPLKPGFDRVLQLGDASASQSPLSFGGFGCMLRHVRRLTASITHALRDDKLTRRDLSWIHAYQPSLSAAWLFQRSMSIGVGQLQQAHHHNEAAAVRPDGSLNSEGSSSSRMTGPSMQSNIVPVSLSRGARIVHHGTSSSTTSGIDSAAGSTAAHSSNNSSSSSSKISGGSRALANGRFDEWLDKLQGGHEPVALAPAATATTKSTVLPPLDPNTSRGSSSIYMNGSSAAPGQHHARRPALVAEHSTTTPSSTSSSTSSGGPQDPGNNRHSSAQGLSWLSQLFLLPSQHINALLGANFSVMAVLGQRVLKPFLQDTLQLGPLAVTMFGMMLVKPLVVSRVLSQVGPKVLFGWFGHFAALMAYTVAHWVLAPLRRFTQNFTLHRILDILEYGSSSDYRYQASKPVSQHDIDRINRAQEAAAMAAAKSSEAAVEAQRQQQQRRQDKGDTWAHGLVNVHRRRQQQKQEAATALATGIGSAA